jgi:ketosteroid isomerase-like protein
MEWISSGGTDGEKAMNAKDSKQFVLDFFAEASSGKTDQAWERLAEDMSWRFMTKASTWPFAQKMTKWEYRKQFVDNAAALFPEGLSFTVKNAIAEDDRVSVEAESLGQLASGKTYNNVYEYRVDLRGGKIQEIREYLDSAYTIEILK